MLLLIGSQKMAVRFKTVPMATGIMMRFKLVKSAEAEAAEEEAASLDDNG